MKKFYEVDQICILQVKMQRFRNANFSAIAQQKAGGKLPNKKRHSLILPHPLHGDFTHRHTVKQPSIFKVSENFQIMLSKFEDAMKISWQT